MSVKATICRFSWTLLIASVTVTPLWAANGSIRLQDGVVTIEGDAFQDLCWIAYDEDEVEVRLEVYDQRERLDDLDRRSFDIDDVQRVVFYGFNGADMFWNSTAIPSVVYGSAGNDLMWGGSASDAFYGGTGDDMMWGDDGDDRLYGGRGRDNLWGQGDHDLLVGGPDEDLLYGGPGNDYLKAGLGEAEHTIYGNEGSDVFAIPQRLLFDRFRVSIEVEVRRTDFDPNVDRTDLFVVYWRDLARGLHWQLNP